MCAPGYYKANYRALSLRAVARARGLFRLPLAYLVTRFMKPAATGWMPQMWADLECQEQDLSERFFQATALYREAFKHAGFSELGFKKVRRFLNPGYRDNGGINYLDGSRCHFGQLIYNRLHVPPPVSRDREHIVIAFTAVFQTGTLSYTNKRKTFFEPMQHHTVVRLPSNDVADIYRRFVGDLGHRDEQPRRFPDLRALQDWFDSNATEMYERWVRQGLYVRMTDDEVAAALRRLPPPLPNQ
jgi:hypothetical protein